MKYPPYPRYKKFDVEWFGDLPAHWQTRRLKNLISSKITDGPHTTPEFLPDGVPFLSVDGIQDGELIFDGCRFVSKADHVQFKKKAFPQHGDLLLGKAASTGKIARVKVDFEFSIWSPLALIKSNLHKVSPHFLEHVLKSSEVQAEIDILCTANTQKNISMEDIPLLSVPYPSLPEQIVIADFLQRETVKIATLIAKQERLIELLVEKRQSIISLAVTEGLNNAAPMKDSGIEWIGEIPAHWEIRKLKRTCSLIKDGTHLPPSRTSEGIPLLSVRNIIDGEFVNLNDDSLISEEDFEVLQKSFSVRERDVLLAIVGATLGKVAIVGKMSPFHIQRSVAVLRPLADIIRYEFLALFLKSDCFQKVLWQSVGFSAQPGIYLGAIANFSAIVPPLTEQADIVNYIDHEVGKINELIQKAKQAVDFLKEHRTALISAAVTGKIDVRQNAD